MWGAPPGGHSWGISLTNVTDRFVELLERADQLAAVRLVTGLAAQGASPEALVLDVLAPAQREVGRRWEDGRWTVAQEHAATAATDTALGLLALDAEPAGDRRALVACVEGEWHSLPARMAAEIMRVRGWDVTFLGPSLPADDLARYVEAQRPHVVGLSCSMPVSLKGAARSVEACRRSGVPVLAGGTGFGPAGRYAQRIGATGWAPDPVTAVSVVQSWLEADPAPPAPVGAGDEHLALEQEKEKIVSAALGALRCRTPAAHDALTFLVTAVENALFVGDPALMADCRPAAQRLLASGDAASPSMPAALDALVAAVEERVPAGRRVLEATKGGSGGGGRRC